MEVKFFCTRWGTEELSWDDFIVKAKGAGYDGIEVGLAHDILPGNNEPICNQWDVNVYMNELIERTILL